MAKYDSLTVEGTVETVNWVGEQPAYAKSFVLKIHQSDELITILVPSEYHFSSYILDGCELDLSLLERNGEEFVLTHIN